MFKKTQKNNLFLFFLISCFFVSFYSYCFAADLEVPLPGLPTGGAITPQSLLPQYLKYIYDFGMTLGLLATVFSLIAAGVLYILSSANPGWKAAAMDRFYGAITGFILLLLLYLIIATINPELRIFQMRGNLVQAPPPPPPLPSLGVYLYADQGCNSSFLTTVDTSLDDLEYFKNKVRSAKIVQGEDAYVAILYDIIKFQGKCQYINPDGNCVSTLWPPNNEAFAASISTYRYNFQPSGGSVTFYRKPSYDTDGGWLEIKSDKIKGIFQEPLDTLAFDGVYNDNNDDECTVPKEEQDCVKWDINGNCAEDGRRCPFLKGENISSIKINGDYVVALLYWDTKATNDDLKWERCQIFSTVDDADKDGPEQIKWDYIRNQDNFPNWVVILPVKEK